MGLIISLSIFGLILMFAEIMIIPGVGLAGILGVLAMGGSCYLSFQDYGQMGGFITLGVNVVITALFLLWALRTNVWKKVALETNITSKVNVPEAAVQVGDKGVAATRLAPMGNARFGTTAVEVTAMDGIISSGSQIEVVLVEGQKIYVKENK